MHDYHKGSLRRGVILFVCAFLLSIFTGYHLVTSIVDNESPELTIAVQTEDPREAVVSLPETDPTVGESEVELPIEEEPGSAEITTVTNDIVAYYILNTIPVEILDIRSQKDYDAGRIRTSTYYNPDTFSVRDFDEDTSYVLVCADDVCMDAEKIIEKVTGSVVEIEVLENGFVGWDEAGFRVVTDEE